MCIVINSEEGKAHKCFANSFKQDCAACLGALFDSREPISMLKCGHAMHKTCFKTLMTADYRCPTCKKAVIDMDEQWAEVEEDMEAAKEEYAELTRQIPQGEPLLVGDDRVVLTQCTQKCSIVSFACCATSASLSLTRRLALS